MVSPPARRPAPAEPVVGETLHLREQDYRFGVGVLTATVSFVVGLVPFDNEPWWHIRAWCRRAPSDPGAQRELYVRARSVPQARYPVAFR
ncbi:MULTISPECIES: hypothetical protein [Catenuloplanes]|uniref:Uncharacterized protein n=1 Tax=Catenuloplanes niger TaxID=587534 RepID=A0AAE3ZU44_9ACTN|nr:hypothetical protein [Catenuloplanes niger]MDR7324203.1 hypothetical protein [Catenuloplanes niger]